MNWIQKSAKKAKKLKDHYRMHDIDIYIKDSLPENIDVDLVFSTISRTIPSHLLRGVDIVYVGQFDVFAKKKRQCCLSRWCHLSYKFTRLRRRHDRRHDS